LVVVIVRRRGSAGPVLPLWMIVRFCLKIGLNNVVSPKIVLKDCPKIVCEFGPSLLIYAQHVQMAKDYKQLFIIFADGYFQHPLN